jgi:predicted nucleotidyltransferase
VEKKSVQRRQGRKRRWLLEVWVWVFYGERFLVDLIPFGVCESRPGEEIKETDAGIFFF